MTTERSGVTKDQEKHTYNLKAVVMETGLKPVTLRAWERRYGFPEPIRTAGGHRLYSQRDIDILKWLIARQKEGISISRAIAMWRSLEEEGQDVGATIMATNLRPGSIPVIPEEFGEQLSDLRQAWVESCMSFDAKRVDAVMTQAFSKFPVEIVCLEVLQKGLSEVGMGWYEGKVTVQQEHFASAQALGRIEMLVAAQPAPTRTERMLVGCAPKDTHTVSTLLLTLFLRRQGWDVIYLGADVPAEQLDKTIQVTEPNLVIFTAQQLNTAATLLPIAAMLNERNIPLAFGGAAFNFAEIRERMPGYYLGESLPEATGNVQKLLVGDLDGNVFQAPDPDYETARRQYEQYRSSIESGLWDQFAGTGFPEDLLSETNGYFGRDISAALRFGHISLLDINMDWLKTLMTNYGWDHAWFIRYLQAYHQEASKRLSDPDHPLLTWLSAQTA